MATDSSGESVRFAAPMVIDATDLGDLLPLTMNPDEWVIGAEGKTDTQEPNAQNEARSDWIQPFTISMVMERHSVGEAAPIPRPDNYDDIKAHQKFSIHDGEKMKTMFEDGNGWWTYRRLIRTADFASGVFDFEISLINTSSNDFMGGMIPTGDPARDAELVEQARQVSTAYAYWVQNECEYGGRTGFSELHLCASAFRTPDGLTPYPYVRESRRILGLARVVEQDIVTDYNTSPRAKFFRDSCGTGKYACDVHDGPTGDQGGWWTAYPYQIRLGLPDSQAHHQPAGRLQETWASPT